MKYIVHEIYLMSDGKDKDEGNGEYDDKDEQK